MIHHSELNDNIERYRVRIGVISEGQAISDPPEIGAVFKKMTRHDVMKKKKTIWS